MNRSKLDTMKAWNFDIKPSTEASWKGINIDKENLAKLEKYLKAGLYEGYNMLIYGINGSGKTFMLHLIGKYILFKKSYQIEYIRFLDLKNLFKTAKRFEADKMKLDNLRNVKYLAIDEFAKGEVSDFVLDELEAFIDYRLNNYKSSIIATNFWITEIDEFGYIALANRLAAENWIKLFMLDKSLRIKK